MTSGPIIPEPHRYRDSSIFDAANRALVDELHREQPEKLRAILARYEGQIDATCVGFVEQYRALSLLIPLHWTVHDFGCGNAPQAWYFRHHARYIGVDSSIPIKYRFGFGNTTHYRCTIQDWIDSGPTLYQPRAGPTLYQPHTAEFAICQYVPDPRAVALIRATFRNVFCYYPEDAAGVAA